MKLAGKVAVITGAGSGIGQTIAIKFSEEGAKVVIAELNESSAHDTRNLLRAKDSDVLVVTTDVSSPSSVADLFKAIDARGWAVDILVNNAGNAGGLKPVHEIDDALWASRIAVHLNGNFY